MLEVLADLGRECAIGARMQAFLQHALASVLLPLTNAQCDRWLRALCRHEDGSDYAKSQRAVFVRELNRVLEEWYKQDLTTELFAVHNYRRDRQYGLLDVEALEYVMVSEVDALKQQFLHELTDTHAVGDRADQLHLSFHRFIFVAITFGGLAWTGVFSDLARLQWHHLRTVAQGYLLVPRWGVEQRIFVPPVVALCALLLGEHLPHPPKARQPHPDQPILPGFSLESRLRSVQGKTDGDEAEIGDDESSPVIVTARVRFNQ